MSAQEELPPGWTWAAGLPVSESRGVHVSRGATSAELAASTWEVWEHKSGITREELATMRAAVERCAELGAALESALVMVKRAYEIGFGGTYGLDGSPYALAREIEKSGLLSDTPTEGECSECGATSEERGLLPCDMPGCPRATPTEGA
jgi:hypothetical protein